MMRVTCYMPHATFAISQVMPLMWLNKYLVEHIIYKVSHDTSILAHDTCHMPHVAFHIRPDNHLSRDTSIIPTWHMQYTSCSIWHSPQGSHSSVWDPAVHYSNHATTISWLFFCTKLPQKEMIPSLQSSVNFPNTLWISLMWLINHRIIRMELHCGSLLAEKSGTNWRQLYFLLIAMQFC